VFLGARAFRVRFLEVSHICSKTCDTRHWIYIMTTINQITVAVISTNKYSCQLRNKSLFYQTFIFYCYFMKYIFLPRYQLLNVFRHENMAHFCKMRDMSMFRIHRNMLRTLSHIKTIRQSWPIAQGVRRRLPTAAALVQSKVRSCEICGGQNDTGAGSLRVLRFPLPILILPNVPY
jgi:hypothetical protein